MSSFIKKKILVDKSGGAQFGVEFLGEYLSEASLMMVKVFYTVIFSFHIDYNIAFLQYFGIS